MSSAKRRPFCLGLNVLKCKFMSQLIKRLILDRLTLTDGNPSIVALGSRDERQMLSVFLHD